MPLCRRDMASVDGKEAMFKEVPTGDSYFDLVVAIKRRSAVAGGASWIVSSALYIAVAPPPEGWRL